MPQFEETNSLRKNVTEFSSLRHLPFGFDISTTIALNLARSGPLETIHPKLFMNIKFEENRA